MGVATDFFLGLREAFTLEHAERAALDAGEARRAEAKRYANGARVRRAAARRLATPTAAVTLLRESLELALVAGRVVRGEENATPIDLATELGPREGVVAEWLAATSPLFVDDLPFAHAEALRDALDVEVTARLAALDLRSVVAIRALRYGRFAAVVFVCAVVISSVLRAKFFPHNVAVGKAVMTNGLRFDTGSGLDVVDGRTRGTFGVYTADAPHPFVTVDLDKSYDITRIRVFNRGDGWYDESLPLALEISEDNVTFQELSRRTSHFDVWTTDPPSGTHARFVRVIKLTPGYVALNEIEIYSRD